MMKAVELKQVLGAYKKALRPPLHMLRHVTPQYLQLNLFLLGTEPEQRNHMNKTLLRRQIARRMREIGFNAVLHLQKDELKALHRRLYGWAQALGGPPEDSSDVRHLPPPPMLALGA